MAIDFIQLADFLQDELQQYVRVVQPLGDTSARQRAAVRLRAVVNTLEAFSYAPGEEEWRSLCESQRWGYLRLESYIGTALYELRQLQRTTREGQKTRLPASASGGEARYA